MTRKHFEAIAATIKAIPFTNENDRVIAACRFADDVCAPANPRFNRALFLKACGVDVSKLSPVDALAWKYAHVTF